MGGVGAVNKIIWRQGDLMFQGEGSIMVTTEKMKKLLVTKRSLVMMNWVIMLVITSGEMATLFCQTAISNVVKPGEMMHHVLIMVKCRSGKMGFSVASEEEIQVYTHHMGLRREGSKHFI